MRLVELAFPFLLAFFVRSGSVGDDAADADACNQKGVLMVEGDQLHAGGIQMVSENFRNSRFNAFINQQHDGNLVVTRGTPAQREGVIWASGIVHSKYDESYYTTMKLNGNLVTQHQNAVLWESRSAGEIYGSYVLAIDCDGKSISIYSGDAVMWSEATLFLDPAPPPTPTPTATTGPVVSMPSPTTNMMPVSMPSPTANMMPASMPTPTTNLMPASMPTHTTTTGPVSMPTPTTTTPVVSTPTPTTTTTPVVSMPTPTTGPAPTLSSESPLVVYAAGDICDPSRSSPGCADTAAIISQEQSSNVYVLPLGDLAYESGTVAEYNRNYETYWGAFKDKTYPVPGNHEKKDDHTGYYAYWGQNGNRSTKPGQQGEGFYSYDLGTSWHFVALNTNDWDSTQSDWLKSDLASNSRPCTLVYGHHPRYSPGKYGRHGPKGVPSMMNEVSQILSDNKADIYLAGHDHIYSRYAKQDANGTADALGTAYIVAGTGGLNTQLVYNQTMSNMEAWFTADPNNALSSGPFGMLRLELRDGDYDVSYLVTAGGFTDSQGATSCNRGLYP